MKPYNQKKNHRQIQDSIKITEFYLKKYNLENDQQLHDKLLELSLKHQPDKEWFDDKEDDKLF